MSQKGFYNDNKEWTEKVKGFFKDSGFYIMIVVGLCILAVGAVYFTTNHLISSPEELEEDLVPDDALTDDGDDRQYIILDDTSDDDRQSAMDDLQNPERRFDYEVEGDIPSDTGDDLVAENDLSEDIPEPEIETIAKPTVAPTAAPTTAPEKSGETQKVDAGTDGEAEEVINLFGKKPEFIMPVEGKIQMDYAMDRLLYSKTLDEWRTHSGIDIEAPRGEVVKAVLDGYVKEIKEDPCYGITITIDHENGYKSIYSNLASATMVSINQKVKAGDPISSVGNTALFECMDPPHLHYEVVKDDKLVDPKTLLPVSKE